MRLLSFAVDSYDDQTAIQLTKQIAILQDPKVHYCVDKVNNHRTRHCSVTVYQPGHKHNFVIRYSNSPEWHVEFKITSLLLLVIKSLSKFLSFPITVYFIESLCPLLPCFDKQQQITGCVPTIRSYSQRTTNKMQRFTIYLFL